ncbi:hypothetical protein Bbelb_090930 [Branchiostoma belcheri]|nr:hypothetical protein Bbelb_090930 [Branchiostoma belcheri]
MGVGTRQTRLVLLALTAAALWSGPSVGTPYRGDAPGGRGEREARPAGRGDPAAGRSDRQDQALWDVVEALEWTVDFFRRSYRDINLDGLYGLRIAEDTFLGDSDWSTRECRNAARRSLSSVPLPPVSTLSVSRIAIPVTPAICNPVPGLQFIGGRDWGEVQLAPTSARDPRSSRKFNYSVSHGETGPDSDGERERCKCFGGCKDSVKLVRQYPLTRSTLFIAPGDSRAAGGILSSPPPDEAILQRDFNQCRNFRRLQGEWVESWSVGQLIDREAKPQGDPVRAECGYAGGSRLDGDDKELE